MSGGWMEELAAEMFADAGREQGLPPVIEDPMVIERFCAMMRAGDSA